MLLSNCLDTIDENAAKQIHDALRKMKIIVNIKSFQDVQDVQDIQLEPNTACVFLCSNLVFNHNAEYLEKLVKHAASRKEVVVFLIEKTLYPKDGIKEKLSKNPTLDDKNIVVIKDYSWEDTGLNVGQAQTIAKRILDEVKAKEEQLARLT